MALPVPNLDDRDFHELMEEARRLVAQGCPDWPHLAPGDPGTVLLEVFAHLTETLIYRLNRLPEKVYVELLRLIGARLEPPVAASTTLRFSRSQESTRAIEIPRGTRVVAERAGEDQEAPVFVTSQLVILGEGQLEVDVTAWQGELIAAELVGLGTGLPGQVQRVQRPPITAPTDSEQDLVVAVEALTSELDERARAIPHGDKVFQIWQEVENFANVRAHAHVYTLDRASGTVQFSPAARWQDQDGVLDDVPKALTEVPKSEREIRVWYRRGGGDGGNVASGALQTLLDPIPGVEVTNPRAATGGRNAESLQNALIRGPQQLHGLERVVKSKDFERVAIRSSGAVARARALTLARLWSHAVPGTVQVVLVPDLPLARKSEGHITAELMAEYENESALQQIAATLNERRPLGTQCVVQWGRYKTVSVAARIVVYREEDPMALRRRVTRRLHRMIQPLPNDLVPKGWGFGETLRTSHIYDMILSEPGVKFADRIQLLVNHVANDVRALAADHFQPRTWYVSGRDVVLRSLNDGNGWELVARFEGCQIRDLCAHPELPGFVAAAARTQEDDRTELFVSEDCGENWRPAAQTPHEVEGMAWLPGRQVPTLLLASDDGLLQVSIEPDGFEVAEVPVLAGDSDRAGFYSVEAWVDVHGSVWVALAAQRLGGIFLSRQGGQPRTFQPFGLRGKDIRSLSVQEDGPNAWLWAAVAAAGNQKGKGCFRRYLTELSSEGWLAFSEGWEAGSCHRVAFQGTQVLAASHRAGVMRLESSHDQPVWQPAAVATSGLPPRDRGRLVPVRCLAVDASGSWIFAGGSKGMFRSGDGGESYESLSKKEFDQVTLPETWLFCSGKHDVEVVTEDEAEEY